MLFVDQERQLTKQFSSRLRAKARPQRNDWVVWRKKSSGVPTDLTFYRVQRIGLDSGLVDVKICAVDEVWSGLKFVDSCKRLQEIGTTISDLGILDFGFCVLAGISELSALVSPDKIRNPNSQIRNVFSVIHRS